MTEDVYKRQVLEKICKPVKELTPRTKELIEDMLDTMYEANGVGLAAPQVGILKRIVVIDVGEGPVVMVNPVILETSGEQTGDEGCLSIPGKAGQVTRPNYVKVHAFDENMEEYEIEGTELMAVSYTHLDVYKRQACRYFAEYSLLRCMEQI